MQDPTRKYGAQPVQVVQKLSDLPPNQQEEVKAWHTLLVGQSNQPKSVMDDMTQAEREAFNQWMSEQTGDPERGGAIDGMSWPGWAKVMERRVKERAGS